MQGIMMMKTFFKEVDNSSRPIQAGIVTGFLIILILSVISLTQCSYISGEDRRFKDHYEEGYSIGYEEGYSIGSKHGYQEGYEVGYSTGSEDGYEDGYSDGSIEGE